MILIREGVIKMKNNNIKKLFEQEEIRKFLEPFEGEKVSIYRNMFRL